MCFFASVKPGSVPRLHSTVQFIIMGVIKQASNGRRPDVEKCHGTGRGISVGQLTVSPRTLGNEASLDQNIYRLLGIFLGNHDYWTGATHSSGSIDASFPNNLLCVI